jgi:hypothetical protein
LPLVSSVCPGRSSAARTLPRRIPISSAWATSAAGDADETSACCGGGRFFGDIAGTPSVVVRRSCQRGSHVALHRPDEDLYAFHPSFTFSKTEKIDALSSSFSPC